MFILISCRPCSSYSRCRWRPDWRGGRTPGTDSVQPATRAPPRSLSPGTGPPGSSDRTPRPDCTQCPGRRREAGPDRILPGDDSGENRRPGGPSGGGDCRPDCPPGGEDRHWPCTALPHTSGWPPHTESRQAGWLGRDRGRSARYSSQPPHTRRPGSRGGRAGGTGRRRSSTGPRRESRRRRR